MRRRPGTAVVVVVGVAVLTLRAAPVAAWTANAGPGDATARASTLGTGNQPAAIAVGASVTVSWPATLLPDGSAVTGYIVKSYAAATGTPRTIEPACTGVVAALSCVEAGVPDGSWRYTVTPRQQAWVGIESAQSVPVTVDSTAPAPNALTLVNNGGVLLQGLITTGEDDVQVTYSEALAVASICSTWSGDGANQSLTGSGVVVTVTNSGSNDILSVTSTSCALHFGSVALGGNYVTTTATFTGTGSNSSTVSWDATAKMLTIHLGALASGLAVGLPQGPGTAVYTPDAVVTDLFGNGMNTTPFSSPNQRF